MKIKFQIGKKELKCFKGGIYYAKYLNNANDNNGLCRRFGLRRLVGGSREA